MANSVVEEESEKNSAKKIISRILVFRCFFHAIAVTRKKLIKMLISSFALVFARSPLMDKSLVV